MMSRWYHSEVSSPGAMTQPSCGERERLQRVVDVCASDYARALEILNSTGKNVDDKKHQQILLYLQELHLKMEETREQLMRHASEHGC